MKYEEIKEKKVKSGIVALYIFLILPFLGIAGIRSVAGGLYQVWQMGSMFTLLIVALVKAKHVKMDSFVMSISLYESIMIGVTTYYSGFSFGIAVVSMVFILLTISAQYYRNEMICALAFISMAVIFINLISVIGRVIGVNTQFFLGGKNQLSMFMIPGAAVIIIHALQNRKGLNFLEVFILICVVISIVAGSSGAGMVCVLLAIGLLTSNKLLSGKKTLLIALVLMEIFLLFGFESLVESELWIRFTTWLGKEATMTGRIVIWETALDGFMDHWLLGNGRAARLSYLSTDEHWMIGYETHNMFLQVLFVTGVVGLAFFSRYLLKAINKLNLQNTKQRILFIAIFICLVNGLVEANNDNAFFRLLLALAYYAGSENVLKKGDENGVGKNEEVTT